METNGGARFEDLAIPSLSLGSGLGSSSGRSGAVARLRRGRRTSPPMVAAAAVAADPSMGENPRRQRSVMREEEGTRDREGNPARGSPLAKGITDGGAPCNGD